MSTSIDAKVIQRDGKFYGWNGKAYVELTTTATYAQLAALVAGTVSSNVGVAATGVTAAEYGDAHKHLTVLTVNQAAAFVLGNDESLAGGSLIYTFPAGALWVDSAYISMTIDNAEHDGEACDVGLGTQVNEAAVSVLGATAGSENILTGNTGAIGTVLAAQGMLQTAPYRLNIPAGVTRTVFLNAAAAWAATAGTALDADIAGTVILEWTFLN